MIEKLKAKGVEIAEVLLHVGLGTFRPVSEEIITDHKMHSEWFNIPEDTLREIERITNGWPSLGGPQPSSSEDGGKCEDRTRLIFTVQIDIIATGRTRLGNRLRIRS